MSQKYELGKYLNEERWASYWCQMKEILSSGAGSVLEIGPGDKVVSDCVKKRFGGHILYKTADIDASSGPDIVCSVDEIKAVDASFELVCAFEVLEHLPFARFEKSLKELNRVSSRCVILSLPHWGRHFSFKLHLPFLKTLKLQFKFNIFPPEHKFMGEHYWEIGKKSYPLGLIGDRINSAGFDIIRDYIAFESPYHHFFILEKK